MLGLLKTIFMATVMRVRNVRLRNAIPFLMIALTTAALTISHVQADEVLERHMAAFKKQASVATLLRVIPESEAVLRDRLAKIIASKPSDLHPELQLAASLVLAEYFDMHKLNASAETTHQYITFRSSVLWALEKKPEACVDFDRIGPASKKIKFVQELHDRSGMAHAAIIESAIVAQEPPAKDLTITKVVQPLVTAYRKFGINPEDLQKLELLDTLPAAEACKVVREFMGVMTMMSKEEATYVFKGLIVLSRK